MAKQLDSVNTAADSFGSWLSKFNAVVQWANTEAVTANSGGAVTTGIGFVSGQFGSNTISTSTLKGGNNTVAANLAVQSNTTFQANVVANTGVLVGNTGVGSINAFSYNTTNTDQQVLDAFPVANWRAAKYVISITDPGNSKYQATEVLVLQDGGNAYSTEYATIQSNGQLATFTADVSGGNCRLLITPSTTVIQVKVRRDLNAA